MSVCPEKEWMKRQGKCCIPDCDNDPELVDDIDNVFCAECAEQNQQEEPDNWEDQNE